jgi:hypothetical protein
MRHGGDHAGVSREGAVERLVEASAEEVDAFLVARANFQPFCFLF